MKTSRKRHPLLTLALGLAAAGILAGPAQARPDDLDGTLSYSRDAQVSLRPDDRATRISPVADKLVDGRIAHAAFATVPTVPDARADRSTFGGGAQVVPVSADDGIQIDWRDAGLGALAATALLALMASMVLILRHSRHQRGLATP